MELSLAHFLKIRYCLTSSSSDQHVDEAPRFCPAELSNLYQVSDDDHPDCCNRTTTDLLKRKKKPKSEQMISEGKAKGGNKLSRLIHNHKETEEQENGGNRRGLEKERYS